MKNAAQKRFVSRRAAAFLILFLFAALGVLHYAGETAAQSDSTIDSEVFTQFDEWVAGFLGGNIDAHDRFIQTGAELARRRRDSFKQLIRTNPRAAIERAIGAETQERLPDSVGRFLEKSVAARGDFNVLVIDGLNSTENYRI